MCLGRPAAECACADAAAELRTWPVACDGQCGMVLDVESATTPDPAQTFFCSDECRAWYGSEPDEGDDSSEHEAGCHCDACLDAIARYGEGEAERAMETVPDGRSY